MKRYLLHILLLSLTTMFGQQGLINTIDFKGLKKTKRTFIEKCIIIQEGQALDSTAIQKDIIRLKQFASIADATYEVMSTNGEGYQVVYTIVENLTLIPSANVWTANNDEFAFRLGLYDFNTFGKNITIGAFYQKDIYDSYGASFKAPYAFSSSWGFEINFQDLTSEEPVFFENATADYRYRNTSYELMGVYQPNFQNKISFGVNYFIENYQYLRGETRDDVPLNLEAHKVAYKLLYTFNNIRYNFYQLSGFKSILNLQYVRGTNVSLPSFLVGWNDFLYFDQIGSKGNWANRLRLGIATNDETPFAPFAVDNNINIRGVGNVIDRGTASIVFNTEYRQTLFEKGWFVLQGNAFIDAGSWRNPGGTLEDLIKGENVRVYPGAGLRFIHKRIFNATFRIDYGHGITKNSSQGIVFGIGQYF